MDDKNLVIGVVGGMGSYATVDFFKRLVEAFPAEKEWERPRVIIDNYCTMPSRVRAILYGEQREELVDMLTDSVRHLIAAGANRLVFVCNTSHVFLPEVFARVPEAKAMVVDIIEACAEDAAKLGIQRISLVASEGTIDTGIYPSVFEKYGIEINAPSQQEYTYLRDFIEVVKQNQIDASIRQVYGAFVSELSNDAVILGCTELPILHQECLVNGLMTDKIFIDPLQSAIDRLKAAFEETRDIQK